jgi:branched-chain amino acid transport system ATP-binding protein
MSEEQAAAVTVEQSAEQPGAALSLRDLTVERGGRPVVRGLSLEIAAGEVTALLGPNAAGKSTLVLAVGGVLRC